MQLVFPNSCTGSRVVTDFQGLGMALITGISPEEERQSIEDSYEVVARQQSTSLVSNLVVASIGKKCRAFHLLSRSPSSSAC